MCYDDLVTILADLGFRFAGTVGRHEIMVILLIGWCHLRKEVTMFVLDRIKMLNVTDRTFEVPGDFDLETETYMRSPFRVIHDRPVKVTVRFDKKVAGYVKEKIWHHTQRIEPQKDGSIIFSAEVAGTDEVKARVMSWGRHAEVLAPSSLRGEIAQELNDGLRHYRPSEVKAEVSGRELVWRVSPYER